MQVPYINLGSDFLKQVYLIYKYDMRCKAHLAEDFGCQAGATSIPTKYRHIS